MIYTITLNPALDKTALVPNMALDGVNRMSSLRLDPGGKGINVSKVIHALGGQSVAVGLLAGRCGRQIADACTALGLTCDFTFTEGETRTNLKIVDPAAHTNTDINEPGIQADEAVLSGMLTRLLSRLTPRDIVVLSGSLPQGAAPPFTGPGRRPAALRAQRSFSTRKETACATRWRRSPSSSSPTAMSWPVLWGMSWERRKRQPQRGEAY